MGFRYNPFTSNLDIVGDGAGVSSWKDPVNNLAALPGVGNTAGDARVTKDTNDIYIWTGSAWQLATGITIGSFSNTANSTGLSVTDASALSLHAADGSNPGAVSTGTQSFSGNKTFNDDVTIQNIDITTGAIDLDGAGTLSIGSVNASTINIGNASATVNFNGTVNNNNVTNLNVTDQLITLNDGGGAGSASGAGFELEENGSATGYVKTSGDRASFILKAPATAGDATITPGSGGITLNQSSHNPVTVVDSNSIDLTLSTQQITADVRRSGSTLAEDASGIKVATAGITDNEVATGISATKIADGSVSNTEFQYLDGVTSAIQTQFTGKANTTLNNLGSTAVNANILPATNNTVGLGSESLLFTNVYVQDVRVNNLILPAVDGSSLSLNTQNDISGSSGSIDITANAVSEATGASPGTITIATGDNFTGEDVGSGDLLIKTGSTAVTATPSGSISILTGDSPDEVTGNIDIFTGTTSAVRGSVRISGSEIDVQNTQVKNAADPTDPQDLVTLNFLETNRALPNTQATLADNTASPTNIPGVPAFTATSVRGFDALVNIYRDGAYETLKLIGATNADGSAWVMSQSGVSVSDTGVTLTITNGGRLQYTTTNTGTDATLTIRAITIGD
jgi:hypothetical protein